MRSTFIAAIIVLALALAVCVTSQILVGHVVDEIDAIRMDVLARYEAGDAEGVREKLVQLADMWERHAGYMEMFMSHEDLHAIKTYIDDASANFEVQDIDDFRRALALLGESMEHIYNEEQLRLANIL